MAAGLIYGPRGERRGYKEIGAGALRRCYTWTGHQCVHKVRVYVSPWETERGRAVGAGSRDLLRGGGGGASRKRGGARSVVLGSRYMVSGCRCVIYIHFAPFAFTLESFVWHEYQVDYNYK